MKKNIRMEFTGNKVEDQKFQLQINVERLELRHETERALASQGYSESCGHCVLGILERDGRQGEELVLILLFIDHLSFINNNRNLSEFDEMLNCLVHAA